MDRPIQAWFDEMSRRLVRHRLNRNLTQAQLSSMAGVSQRTVERLEDGRPVQMESFLRVLFALDLGEGLELLVPEVPVSPIQRLERAGKVRERATGKRKKRSRPAEDWSWGSEP